MDIVSDEVKRVRFKKLQSNYIVKVLEKNNWQLTNEEWLQLLSKSGYIPNYLTLKRIKRIMGSDLVKQDTENKLMKFYIESGYDQDFLKDLLDSSIQAAKNKEQSNVLFQIYQHLESKHFPESKTKTTITESVDLGNTESNIQATFKRETTNE